MSRTAALVVTMAMLPAIAYADRGALTLEGGALVGMTRIEPSVGEGDAVSGTVGGAIVGVRYALSHTVELQASGFWSAPVDFVHRPVAVATPAGTFGGDLRRKVSRTGASIGARYVVRGFVWRFPVGAEAGWVRTSSTSQDLVPSPGSTSFVALDFADSVTNRLFIAPFAGLEWQAGDHISVSVLPRLEIPVTASSSSVLVVPLTVGWTWFLM